MAAAASIMEGQWWWSVVILVGGLLAGGYAFMVLGKVFGFSNQTPVFVAPVARYREMITLALAICAAPVWNGLIGACVDGR